MAGALWMMLGALSVFMSSMRSQGGWPGPVVGVFFIGMGVWYLVKYRNPEVRAKHVEYWTAKA
jgi:hypothetical protein